MDPNADLEEQIKIAKEILDVDLTDSSNKETCIEDDLLIQGQRLAELVMSLDTWIVSGGFIPGRWSK